MRSRWVFVVAVLLVAKPASAQGPEEVVRAFFQAEDDGRWLDAARMMDLQAFEPFRRNMLRGLQMAHSFARMTPEDLMKQEPDMPRAVAEYQIKEMNEHMRDFNYLEHEFARVESADTLRGLSIDEAAARWLEAKGPKWSAELAHREDLRHPPHACPPEYPDSVVAKYPKEWAEPKAHVLGAATGSDTLSYVVIGVQSFLRRAITPPADDLEPIPGPSPHVLTLRKVGGAWKILPAFDMPNSSGVVGGSIVATLVCRTEAPADAARKMK